jgi:hypothetical protein
MHLTGVPPLTCAPARTTASALVGDRSCRWAVRVRGSPDDHHIVRLPDGASPYHLGAGRSMKVVDAGHQPTAVGRGSVPVGAVAALCCCTLAPWLRLQCQRGRMGHPVRILASWGMGVGHVGRCGVDANDLAILGSIYHSPGMRRTYRIRTSLRQNVAIHPWRS